MDRRLIGVGLVALGLALSLAGTFSNDWLFVHGSDGVSIGLRELESCHRHECHTTSLQAIPIGDRFAMMGNVAYFAPLIAGAMAVVASVLAMNRVVVNGPISPARLSTGFYTGGVLAAITFVADGPDGAPNLDLGWAAIAAIAGAALAGAGAFLLSIEEKRAKGRVAHEPPAPLPRARAVPPRDPPRE